MKTSIMDKIYNRLCDNTSSPGITAKALAKKAGTTTDNVYRRISDLRNEFGVTVFANKRVRTGRKVYYRVAA